MDGPPHTLHSAADLAGSGLIDAAAADALAAVSLRYAIAITPAMQSLIERSDDPIGLQFVPNRTDGRAA
jgi:lysine 2,3-aminomutase